MSDNGESTIAKIVVTVVAVGIIGIVTFAVAFGIQFSCGPIFGPDTCTATHDLWTVVAATAGFTAMAFVLWLIWRSPQAVTTTDDPRRESN
jgi:NhaP-type Na+/H+ or K+/H+ antiporter